LWFQGSVLASVALLGLFIALPDLDRVSYTVLHPAVLLLVIWGVCFDGTHVWGTYARTYLAPDADSRANLPGRMVWLWLLVGPVLAVVDALVFEPSPSLVLESGLLFKYFLTFAYLWAYWHLIRQHYGFLVLYRRKSQEEGLALDTVLLWGGTLYPYLIFSLSPAYATTGLPHVFPEAWWDEARLLTHVAMGIFLLVMLGIAIARRKVASIRWGPKHLLLAIVIAFHNLVFLTLENLLVITAVLTLFHNLQYHRIVWQYERGKDRIPMGSVSVYLGLGLLFGLVWYGPRILGTASTTSNLVCNVLLGLGWGIAFHHYAVDAIIWRVRRSPRVAKTLDAGARG